MKVFVIYKNDYDACLAEGVYSSLEKARAEINSMRSIDRHGMEIKEFEVDAASSFGVDVG